jgi:hypothetical protein
MNRVQIKNQHCIPEALKLKPCVYHVRYQNMRSTYTKNQASIAGYMTKQDTRLGHRRHRTAGAGHKMWIPLKPSYSSANKKNEHFHYILIYCTYRQVPGNTSEQRHITEPVHYL